MLNARAARRTFEENIQPDRARTVPAKIGRISRFVREAGAAGPVRFVGAGRLLRNQTGVFSAIAPCRISFAVARPRRREGITHDELRQLSTRRKSPFGFL